MKPVLSVIVPVFNVDQYLRKCVDSILVQSYKDFELLLIDDGSTDSSSDICDEFSTIDSRIRCIHKINEGLSCTRNLGIEISAGDYIAFIDSDDWIEQGMFKTMIEKLEFDKSDICICGIRAVDENGRIDDQTNFDKSMVLSREEATSKILLDLEIPSYSCNKIFAKKLWQNVTFPQGMYYEDIATIYKIFDKAEKVSITEKIYYNYFRRSNSICLDKDPYKNIKRLNDSFIAFYNRYFFARDNHYTQVLNDCAQKALLRGIFLIHELSKYPNFGNDLLSKSSVFNMINNLKLESYKGIKLSRIIELLIYKYLPFLYKAFWSLITNIKNK